MVEVFIIGFQHNQTFYPFLGTYSVGKVQHCTVCPKGKFCPYTTNATETDCDPGTFSLGGQERCTPCPSGWECPNTDGTGNVKCFPVSILVNGRRSSEVTCKLILGIGLAHFLNSGCLIKCKIG